MYSRPRIIPCLSISNRDLVKTTKFQNPRYIGDPINAVKIFNNKYVDEICILDISVTKENKSPDFEYLTEIANEAFMPLSYGGGIKTVTDIERIFYIGYEKVIINTEFFLNPNLIKEAVQTAGSQSIVVSIDYKCDYWGNYSCYIKNGKEKTKISPIEMAKRAENLGAGELLLCSIQNDGMMNGYNIQITKQVSEAVKIPIIAYGGAGKIEDISEVLKIGRADAVAASSLFIYYGKKKAILITVPGEEEFIKQGIYSI